ncbi:MAG: pimeloyl-ACP methyl ester carboxylesterase [Candidatus Azotimanducaceae bacterium]|jgi:pimeloyl-ACP methyl ester carboxylesterase
MPISRLLFFATLIIGSTIGSSAVHAAEPSRHTIIADGHPLALWEKSATKANKTILLLHGRTYSSLPDFDLKTPTENLSFMDELVKRGFRVFALDARGYGESPRDESGWLTPNRAAADVRIVLDWLHEKTGMETHLYGWSYGSMVAQLVAQRDSQDIASIILFGYPFNPQRHVLAADRIYPAKPPAKANSAKHAASDFITPGSISQSAIDGYVRAALVADPIRVDFKNLHEWAELDASKISTPTLLLQGEFDPVAPTHIQQVLFTGLGTQKKWWVVLEGGDHAALLETPRIEMLDAISTFAQHSQ